MILKAESSTHETTGGTQQPVVHHGYYLTPAQAINRLPKDATPAQQDSAVQAHAKISEIHWSEMPDTLHMPGHGKGKTVNDSDIPQHYYRESYFSNDSLFHPELKGGRQGVAGDPVPYSIAGDNFISSLFDKLRDSIICRIRIQRHRRRHRAKFGFSCLWACKLVCCLPSSTFSISATR